MSYDPWEDEDGHLFHVLDNELAAANVAGSEVLLPVGNFHELAWVLFRKCDTNGALVGIMHKQPALATPVHKALFPDGHSEELAANAIAETLYAQSDGDSNKLS